MRGRSARHGCALLLGLAVAVVAIGLGLACLLSTLSLWGIGYALGFGLLAGGLLAFAFRRRRARVIAGAGAALLLIIALLRLAQVGRSDGVRLTTLPDDDGPRVVARLFAEADGSLPAARLLELGGGLDDEEGPEFEAILGAAYERMPGAGSTATPAIATYLGLQRPSAFDSILIGADEKHGGAVIFLHGYAGNFLVYCWEFAQAARAAGLLTVCPSVDSRGAWWSANGEKTMLEALRYVRQLGAKRVYLAGLSNGAAGASVLALRHPKEFAGLVLISGMRAKAAPPGLPILVVQGSRDRMMPASFARAYAKGAGASYSEIRGGHLIFLSRHEQVRPVIREFLKKQEAGKTL